MLRTCGEDDQTPAETCRSSAFLGFLSSSSLADLITPPNIPASNHEHCQISLICTFPPRSGPKRPTTPCLSDSVCQAPAEIPFYGHVFVISFNVSNALERYPTSCNSLRVPQGEVSSMVRLRFLSSVREQPAVPTRLTAFPVSVSVVKCVNSSQTFSDVA